MNHHHKALKAMNKLDDWLMMGGTSAIRRSLSGHGMHELSVMTSEAFITFHSQMPVYGLELFFRGASCVLLAAAPAAVSGFREKRSGGKLEAR